MQLVAEPEQWPVAEPQRSRFRTPWQAHSDAPAEAPAEAGAPATKKANPHTRTHTQPRTNPTRPTVSPGETLTPHQTRSSPTPPMYACTQCMTSNPGALNFHA